MADKETVEKRAQKLKKTEKIRKAILASVLLGFSAVPFIIRKGMLNQNGSKFINFLKAKAHNFAYKDGIFISRFPFFLAGIACHFGMICASRNETDSIRAAVSLSAFSQVIFLSAALFHDSQTSFLRPIFLKKLQKKHCKINFCHRQKNWKDSPGVQKRREAICFG